MKKDYVAIIEARLGSKRFQKKMLPTLTDKKIIHAKFSNKENDIFVKIADKYKISIFRGSQNNFQERFAEAAKNDNSFLDLIFEIGYIDNLKRLENFVKNRFSINSSSHEIIHMALKNI